MATTTSQHRPKGLLSKNSTKNPIRFPLLPNGNNTTSNNNITTNKSTNKSTNKDSSYEYGNILAGSKKRLGKTKINIVEKKDLLVTGIGTIQPTKTYPKDEPFQHEEAPIYSKALLQGIILPVIL
ncbi:uncharacterized protein TRIADDRAFT_58092 [Trichoplax adhaerens]|uniref:Uncharacterized protein n=1 Tax=Trichoplax adhaerens TaxID=10228 RepID=B3S2N7_TRIAD|nr:predicted protein [Trichoplax adhaerens]EDV23450.1 predicted protein [Trichoplax adhaerens]|eukprot:XP_002114360.1 predicted protein [Trichoplax adhaerens]